MILTLFVAEVIGQKIVEDENVQQREIGDSFSSIKINGNLEVWISQDAGESLAVSADNIRDRDAITTEVREGVLHVTGGRGRGQRRGRVYISFKELEKLELSGVVSLNVIGSIRQEALVLSVSGVSEFTGMVSLRQLVVNLSGVSEIKASGDATEATINCSGTSEFKSIDLKVDRATVVASGTSEVELGVSSELTVTASGSSDVVYRGRQPVVNKAVSGTSTVKKIL